MSDFSKVFQKSEKKSLALYRQEVPEIILGFFVGPSFCYTGFTEWYVLLNGWTGERFPGDLDSDNLKEKRIFNLI